MMNSKAHTGRLRRRVAYREMILKINLRNSMNWGSMKSVWLKKTRLNKPQSLLSRRRRMEIYLDRCSIRKGRNKTSYLWYSIKTDLLSNHLSLLTVPKPCWIPIPNSTQEPNQCFQITSHHIREVNSFQTKVQSSVALSKLKPCMI